VRTAGNHAATVLESLASTLFVGRPDLARSNRLALVSPVFGLVHVWLQQCSLRQLPCHCTAQEHPWSSPFAVMAAMSLCAALHNAVVARVEMEVLIRNKKSLA